MSRPGPALHNKPASFLLQMHKPTNLSYIRTACRTATENTCLSGVNINRTLCNFLLWPTYLLSVDIKCKS
jgi:hypothetical protein